MAKDTPSHVHIAYAALIVSWLAIGLISAACWTFLYLNALGFGLTVLWLIGLFAGPIGLVRYFHPAFAVWRAVIRRTMQGLLSGGASIGCVLILFGKQITQEDPDGRFLIVSPSAVFTVGVIGGFILLSGAVALFTGVSAWVGPYRPT